MSKKLNEDFLAELIKLTLRRKSILEVCKANIQYHFIPIESYKLIWKEIVLWYDTQGTLPSIGLIAQNFNSGTDKDKKALEAIRKIKDANLLEEKDALIKLEEFIKNSIAVDFYDKFGTIYNNGDKDKAIDLLTKVAEDLTKFSLYNGDIGLIPVFKSFSERLYERQHTKKVFHEKIFFGIDEIDDHINGGFDPGDTVLIIAQSGIGKTKCLRHIGVTNARRGKRGLHIQLEDSQEACELGYDATWSAIPIYDLEVGKLGEEKVKELTIIANQVIANGGEIFMKAYEQFNSATTLDVRELILEYYKLNGFYPEFILIDYFELLEPGNGKRYATGVEGEKAKRQQLGKELKNIALEFNTVVIVPTQASGVEPTSLNNPEFHLTRYNISGDKNQINPFSFVFSLNQTEDEYQTGLMRIFADKIRKYKRGWVAKIYGDYKHEKFYARRKTLKELHNTEI